MHEEFPERAECDFGRRTQSEPFPRQLEMQFDLPEVQCMFCNRVVPQPFYVVKHFGRCSQQLPFCNEQHSQDYYMRMIRSSGAV